MIFATITPAFILKLKMENFFHPNYSSNITFLLSYELIFILTSRKVLIRKYQIEIAFNKFHFFEEFFNKLINELLSKWKKEIFGLNKIFFYFMLNTYPYSILWFYSTNIFQMTEKSIKIHKSRYNTLSSLSGILENNFIIAA